MIHANFAKTKLLKKYAALFFGLVLLMPFVAIAAEMRSGDKFTLRKGDTIPGDFYTAGGTIIVAGNVDGDLVTAGGTISISGNIREDLIVGGGSVNLYGNVDDDMRGAAGSIVIGGIVRGDVVVAGGEVHLISGSAVEGDVIIAGGRVVLDGRVEGEVQIAGGEVTINDFIGGETNVRAEKVTLGSEAIIQRDFNYSAPKRASVDDNAVIRGNVNYTEKRDKSFASAFVGAWTLIKFLMLAALGLALAYVFPGKTKVILKRLFNMNDYKKALLVGLGWMFITPIAIIILAITVIGIPFALLLVLSYIGSLIIACAYSVLFLGGLAKSQIMKREGHLMGWKTVLAGSLLAVILGNLPIIGLIIWIGFFLPALGVIVQMKYAYIRSHQ